MKLKNRRIVITGAARGIGRATGELFRREGANVAWLDINLPGVQAMAKEYGGVAVGVDVRDEASVAQAVEAAGRAMGGIDGLVNCAGIASGTPYRQIDTKLWREILDVNLTGTFLMCHAVLPWMDKNESGTIVNLASAQAIHPTGASAAYAASKGGVLIFSKNIAIDLAPKIRVNIVCPGTTDTPMVDELMAGANPEVIARNLSTVPMNRLAKASEQADAILFFTSDQSSFVTGAALAPDGGRTRH